MEYYGDILKKKEIRMYKIASVVFWFFGILNYIHQVTSKRQTYLE
jgi:hypothetical protein